MGKNQYEDQQSLFDMDGGNLVEGAARLAIVNAKYIDSGNYTWEELFEGFDELSVITYSSGIKFIKKVLAKVKKAEIIFGCEGIINADLETIIAMQTVSLEYLQKSKTLSFFADKIAKGTLQLYLSNDCKSHEKIFLLKSENGKTRVITGSANMSASAFCGLQRENIICFNDSAAYEYYYGVFQDFKNACSSPVLPATVKRYLNYSVDDLRDDLEIIPIMTDVVKKKIIVLEDAGELQDNVEIITSVKELANELKPFVPKKERDSTKIVLTGDVARAANKRYKKHRIEEKERRKIFPKLHIDYEHDQVMFNEKPLDLNPAIEGIKADVQCVLNFFSSFEGFYGNIQESQRDYYAFLNWFFASPFMPYLRLIGNNYNYSVSTFPTIGIIYGESNGGKSTFVRLLTKLMCGFSVPMNSSSDFTAGQIDLLRNVCEGIPINIDDLAKAQFTNNSEKIIKDDYYGIKEKKINYPAITITTNKIPSLSADITKRTVTCYIDARIDKEAGAKNAKKINESLNQASTALFGEYCRRMLEEIHIIADYMKTGEEGYFPDIFQVSSKVLYDVFSTVLEDKPEYISELCYADYFGDQAVGRKAIQKLSLAWKNEPKQFKIDRKNNKVRYSYPEAGALYELAYLQQELPPSMNVKRTATSIIMDLDVAEQYLGIRLRKRIFG